MTSSPFRFEASTPADVIQAAIAEYGCAIVENVLSKEDLAELNAQSAPFIAAVRPVDQSTFLGAHTVRFGRLLWRVPKVREIIRNPVTIAALDRTLLPLAPRYKLFFDGIMHVMAGQKAQVLHRDNTPFENPAPPVVLATMWAAEDFRKENGATVFVPGSHKWPESRHPTKEELCVAEMPAGSVLFYVGNLIHGAGKCISGTRTGLSLQYSVSWLQQDENQAYALPMEVACTLDEELLKLAGINIISRNCGTVDQMHPLDFVLQDGKQRDIAEPGSQYSNGTTRSLLLEAGAVRSADCHYHVELDD